MPIVTRTGKGSKLTIAEMDGNLTTLNNQSFQNGVYTVLKTTATAAQTSSISIDSSTNNIILSHIIANNGAITSELLDFSPATFETDTIVIGTYENVTPSGGSGTGLVVTVEVIDDRGVPSISSVTVTERGLGYAKDDVLEIPTSALGADPSTESASYTLLDGDFVRNQNVTFTVRYDGITASGLPGSDPAAAGQLWVDSAANYVIKVSQG